jgi:hypothetical protein
LPICGGKRPLGLEVALMNRLTKLACAGVAAYFLAAWYATVSYVDVAPKGISASQIIGPFHKVKGLFVSRVWLATEGAVVVIYENGVSLGRAESFYDDPDNAFSAGGKRWQNVEFFADSDPNSNGRHYWAARGS